jgi:hypothetical protein
VTLASPADGAVGVLTSTTVSATFDEPMNTASAQAAFSLAPSTGGPALGGTFSWSGNRMTFDPAGNLAEGTSYAAVIAASARDTSGNALAAQKAWTFRTLVSVTSTAAATVIESGGLRAGGASRLGADDNSFFEVDSTTGGTRTASWYGSFSGVANALGDLKVTFKGKASRSITQTVSIWNWSTSSWKQLDLRSVGTSEVLVESMPTGTLADYVSGATGQGELRISVRSTLKKPNFYVSGDLLKIAYVRP